LQGEPCDAAVNFNTYQILQYIDNGTFMYAKHGNLVDADASGTKATTKHLESRLKVIQGLSISVFENTTVIRHRND